MFFCYVFFTVLLIYLLSDKQMLFDYHLYTSLYFFKVNHPFCPLWYLFCFCKYLSKKFDFNIFVKMLKFSAWSCLFKSDKICLNFMRTLKLDIKAKLLCKYEIQRVHNNFLYFAKVNYLYTDLKFCVTGLK